MRFQHISELVAGKTDNKKRFREDLVRGEQWTQAEEDRIMDLFYKRYSYKGIATIVGRTPNAVKSRIDLIRNTYRAQRLNMEVSL